MSDVVESRTGPPSDGDVVFDASDVHFRYPRAAYDAVAGASVHVRTGEFVALLGPNGSGKSTLLRLLLGALVPAAGAVRFRGRDIAHWPRDAFAREVGVVAQAEEFAFPLTVRELVGMGRYPHLGAWRREGAGDRAAIERALDRCEVAQFATRSVLELSGGERQRVRLARALAQEPRTFVLDEPTASLDMAHEMEIFELMHDLARDGATVVLVTHNINLAARYASRLVLMERGAIAAAGAPADVVVKQEMERVYGWPVVIRQEEGTPQVVPVRRQQQGHVHVHDRNGETG